MRKTLALVPFVLLSLIVGADAQSPAVTFQSLLAEMTDRDTAARFPSPAYTCRQASSYDQASTSADDANTWMANNDRSFFLRSEENQGRQEWVMLDADGPGCIVRIWITASNACGTLRVYVDGASEPVLAEEAQKLIGDNVLLGPPLSETRARGRNLYLPIPYGKHCKITYDRPNFQQSKDKDDLLYYQINYRTYAEGSQVESFNRETFDASKSSIEQLQTALLKPAEALPNDLKHYTPPTTTLQPDESMRVTLPGPAAVRQLIVQIKADDLALATRQTVLSAEFDGQSTLACPVGDFFGSGVGVNPFQGWWREVKQDGQMICYWPMPYREGCRLRLKNHGQQPVTLTVKAATGPWTWDDRSMYFHTDWRQQYPISTRPMHDWNYLEAAGQGVYMGDTLCVVNPVTAWWGEGDEKIYVDGEAFPSHFGTGTEDYYGYAWCTPAFFESPFHAQPRAQGPGNFGHTTNTRVRLLDGIPFTKSLKVDMEVWHWKECEVAYAVATYWYGRPGAQGNHTPDAEQLKVVNFEKPKPPKPRMVEDAIEGEGLRIAATTGGTTQIQKGASFRWSNNQQLWWIDGKPGDKLTLIVPVKKAGTYKLAAELTKAVDYGIVQLTLDGKSLADPIDLYNDGVTRQVYPLGTHELSAGEHRLTVEIIGANEKAVKRHMFGLDYLKLEE